MTAQVLFDTARFRDRLTSSGMPDAQARAVTEGFEDALRDATATKADVERQGNRLDAKIDAVEARLSARSDLLDETVGRRIAEASAAQLRWIIASLVGGLGLQFAALKLFP